MHTNVAGPKINLEDFPLILLPSLPSAYWEKVSVTLTNDQRNGLLSGEHYLHVALVGARTHAWDPLEFMLEDPNGICLALWGPLAATEARDRRRIEGTVFVGMFQVQSAGFDGAAPCTARR